jgi:hypothetical protein
MTTSPKTRLPAPEQLMLAPLGEMELAELIEQHIEFVDLMGRPVHLQRDFVMHYLKRDDGGLPTVSSIAQLPIVLPNGELLSGRGLNRKYGIIFRVPPELVALLPARVDCTPEAVGEAMQFLMDEWLCDVATSYEGKGIIIAAACTIIERALLPSRPVFFITAGQRGGGKTTTLHMISMAAVGLQASAAAWSASPEERRKALLSYLDAALPMLVWDNIPRGTTISCPSIEKASTTEFYTDRVLGVSEHKTVATYTVQFFTGNNIAPRGDLASRALSVRLTVNQPDPENRPFKHPDPIGWTHDNRGRILASLYTILLGNQRLGQTRRSRKAAPTRFKEWWEMVGSAVEFAARQHLQLAARSPADRPSRPVEIDFKKIFGEAENDDEESTGLAAVLVTLQQKWKDGFKAKDVLGFIESDEGGALRTLLMERDKAKGTRTISSITVAWALKPYVDVPVAVEEQVIVLRRTLNRKDGDTFKVERLAVAATASSNGGTDADG